MRACRSLLYVPGNRAELIKKIERFDADAYILDLEDGVPEDQKKAAQDTIAQLGPALSATGKSLHVRLNALPTSWHRADVERMLEAGLCRLHIPKVSCADDLRAVDQHVCEVAERLSIAVESIELYPTLETARGMLAAAEICGASPRIVGVLLGGDDFTAEVGATRTSDGRELDYVRQLVIVAANANGVIPIDATYPFHRDLEGCARDAAYARALGYRGKQAVHPAQCQVLNAAFTPSSGEIERATAIVAAAELARSRGHGTATAHGTQIDAAVEKRARALLTWRSS